MAPQVVPGRKRLPAHDTFEPAGPGVHVHVLEQVGALRETFLAGWVRAFVGFESRVDSGVVFIIAAFRKEFAAN